ncbi:MAG TPA: succinate dehydrogenase, cytochrome b556 subunit [Pseudomonadales bacterium]|nr:succinate dehydrogenase, cytochrome b556 subunit [Pseudomonadales bacterium]
MTDKRPVNLDIGTIKLPITAYVSILHRASGVALIGAVGILLGLLAYSLKSAEDFASVLTCMNSVAMKLVLWAILTAFIYHMLAGIKHLVMDMGIGETLEGGKRGAVLVLVSVAIGVLLAGVWIW